MALQGNTILTLSRDKDFKHIIKRIEKHNDITPYVQSVLGAGNFQYRADPSKLMPVLQFFKGCLLTDNENVASTMMMAGNSNVTAQAGDDSYTTGTNLKRGSFNANESGAIAGGYRLVFDWLTNQGNGQIRSVMLCRPQIGKAEYLASALPEDGGQVIETLYASQGDVSETFARMTIIDYDKETAYKVTYSSDEITILEYAVNTKKLHLLGARDEFILKNTHTISQTVSNYGTSTTSVSYTGDKIHVISFSGNNLYDYAIDTTAWTVTATSHTYANASFSSLNVHGTALVKDAMPIIGNYLYAYGSNNTKILKCNLTNDADITAVDNPMSGVVSRLDYCNGAGIILPNGDWYKFGGEMGDSSSDYLKSGIYYHNSVPYVVKHGMTYARNFLVAMNGNNYGTQLMNFTHANGDSGRWARALTTMFPYVSTVNNLEETVTKDLTMYMKLTYELTEVAS